MEIPRHINSVKLHIINLPGRRAEIFLTSGTVFLSPKEKKEEKTASLSLPSLSSQGVAKLTDDGSFGKDGLFSRQKRAKSRILHRDSLLVT